MAKPTLASDIDSALNATTPKAVDVGTTAAGDLMVASRGMEGSALGNLSLPTQTSGPTFAERATVDANDFSTAETRVATGLATGATANDVSNACTGGGTYGCNVMRWADTDGYGGGGTSTSGTGNFNATATQANSAIIVAITDWDAGDHSASTCTIGGTSATRTTHLRNASLMTFVVFYLDDCGASGTKAVDFSGSGTLAIGWVEVLGTAAAAATDWLYERPYGVGGARQMRQLLAT